jgi:hypothetical protein
MACAIEEETTRLHPKDAISTKLWVENLKQKNVSMFYKFKLNQSPADSVLQADPFMLCIQTAFQLDAFWHLSN